MARQQTLRSPPMKLGKKIKRQAKHYETLKRLEASRDMLKIELHRKYNTFGYRTGLSEKLFELAYKYGKGKPVSVELYYNEMRPLID